MSEAQTLHDSTPMRKLKQPTETEWWLSGAGGRGKWGLANQWE